MGIFTAGVELLKNVVSIIGGAMAIIGIIQLLQGYGEQGSGGQKTTGMGLFIAGGGIFLVAQTLIPMLSTLG